MERRVQLIRWGCKRGGNKVEVPVEEKCMKLRARRKEFWDMKDIELKGNTGKGGLQGRHGLGRGCPLHSVQFRAKIWDAPSSLSP